MYVLSLQAEEGTEASSLFPVQVRSHVYVYK